MRARRLRVLRGSTAASVATVVASTAHTLAGGGAPPFWLLIAVTLLAAPIAVALIGGRRSLTRLAATVAAAQLMLHTAFAAVGSDAPLAGHGHVHGLVTLTTALSPATAGMTAGHAIAAVVTFVMLATGERMLRALARGIRRLLHVADDVSLPGATARRPVSPRPRLHAAKILTSVSRRGPPALAH